MIARTPAGIGICLTRGWSDADGQHEAAESEAAMCPRAGSRLRPFTLHRKLQKLKTAARLIQERVGPPTAATAEAPSRRARAECDALVDLGSQNRSSGAGPQRAPARRGRRCCASDRSAAHPPTAHAMNDDAGAARRTAVTRSPSASTASPEYPKPMATLPTEAGANAVARPVRCRTLQRRPRD